MINKVILMGRLTADPELKQTNKGTSVASFTIAVERNYSQKGEKRQADFINVVAWRQTAEFICKYFTKGQLIAVDGTIQVGTYEDKNGNKRTAVEVVAKSAHFTGDRKHGGKEEIPPPNEAPQYIVDMGEYVQIEDDEELPF